MVIRTCDQRLLDFLFAVDAITFIARGVLYAIIKEMFVLCGAGLISAMC